MATEKIWDMMRRSSSPYGTAGVVSYAISALDNAIWDLKGKLLKKPVYELLGGPVKDDIFCYASNTMLKYKTSDYMDWFLELGFKAVKVFLRHGPDEGLEGLNKNVEIVAKTREQIGPDIELAVDSWMSSNIEYAVRVSEALKPYSIKWLEDYMLPEDMDSYSKLRQRVPAQTLATGEHWYLPPAFAFAARRKLADIFQPDLLWAGGLTACVHIAHIAEANGLTVVPHGGMNWPYGQHLVSALPATTWGERSGGGSPRGVPLTETVALPGTAVIEDGFLAPSDAPGFGIDLADAWLEKVTV